MPDRGAGYQQELSTKERDLIEAFVSDRANNSTTERTQKKQRHISYIVCHYLHEQGTTLDKATGLHYAELGKKITVQNSRQTIISQAKAMVRFIDENHHTIKDTNKFLDKVKAG